MFEQLLCKVIFFYNGYICFNNIAVLCKVHKMDVYKCTCTYMYILIGVLFLLLWVFLFSFFFVNNKKIK